MNRTNPAEAGPESEEASVDASRALADELRAIAQQLMENEVGTEDAARALALARAIRPHLDGPPRARWYEADPPVAFGRGVSSPFDQLSPLRGRLNPVAPPLEVGFAQRDDGRPIVVGHARLESRYEGPPRGVHGGFVAALFDEILGASMALAPPPGVTAKLEVDYRHLTPIDEPLRLEAWIEEDRHRRILARATCHAGDTLTAEARGLFVRVDFDEVEARMRARSGERRSRP